MRKEREVCSMSPLSVKYSSSLPSTSSSPSPSLAPSVSPSLSSSLSPSRKSSCSLSTVSSPLGSALTESLSLLAKNQDLSEPVELIANVACSGRQYRLIIEPVEQPSADKKRAPKRKPSASSPVEQPYQKRPPTDLSSFTEEELVERKKQQNREAAQRYRQKLKNNKESNKTEMEFLEERNEFLRKQEIELSQEISRLRQILFSEITK